MSSPSKSFESKLFLKFIGERNQRATEEAKNIADQLRAVDKDPEVVALLAEATEKFLTYFRHHSDNLTLFAPMSTVFTSVKDGDWLGVGFNFLGLTQEENDSVDYVAAMRCQIVSVFDVQTPTFSTESLSGLRQSIVSTLLSQSDDSEVPLAFAFNFVMRMAFIDTLLDFVSRVEIRTFFDPDSDADSDTERDRLCAVAFFSSTNKERLLAFGFTMNSKAIRDSLAIMISHDKVIRTHPLFTDTAG